LAGRICGAVRRKRALGHGVAMLWRSRLGRWFWRRVMSRLLRTSFDVDANCPEATRRSWPSMRIARGVASTDRVAQRWFDATMAGWRCSRQVQGMIDGNGWEAEWKRKLQANHQAALQRGSCCGWNHPPPHCPMKSQQPADERPRRKPRAHSWKRKSEPPIQSRAQF